MPEYQWLANLVLTGVFVLPPVALGAMLIGRSRGKRKVLRAARGLAVVTVVLAAAYDIAGAVCLLLAEPRADHPPWEDPSAVVVYPEFFLPIGLGAFVAGLGVLIGVTRATHKLG
ncbi:hypothetical protein [Kribbella sp. NPDC048915]|uniref:hypothetical protein n=1 Tax=Kribbella sp. NPDC048915 TaxID=3155148 RepID=UPI0034042E1E